METVRKEILTDTVLTQLPDFNKKRVVAYLAEYRESNSNLRYRISELAFVRRMRQYTTEEIFLEIMRALNIDWEQYDLSDWHFEVPEEA